MRFLTVSFVPSRAKNSLLSAQNLTISSWANRAGHIAASQFPLIVGLAAKNNAIECGCITICIHPNTYIHFTLQS